MMTSNFKRAALIATAVLLALGGAQAATVTLLPSVPAAVNGYANSDTVPYINEYTFTLASGNNWDLTGSFTGKRQDGLPAVVFSDTAISLVDLSGASSPSPASFAPGMSSSFTFDNLVAGSYTLKVAAKLISGTGGPYGFYGGYLQADASASSLAVPEPTEQLLALAGLAVCALLLRRRT